MTEIKALFDRIYSNPAISNTPKGFIELYEADKSLIEGVDSSRENPDFDDVLKLTCDYALSLSFYGSSKKALLYLEKAIRLIEANAKSDMVKDPTYEMLVFRRGIESYNQKNYLMATSDFEFLVNTYPENENYKKWLATVRMVKIDRFLMAFLYVAFAALLLEMLVGKNHLQLKFYLIVGTSVLFLLAGALVLWRIWVKFSIQRK